MADIFRLVGAMDAVQGVLVALVKIERPRAQRIGRTSGNALRVGAEPGLDLRRGDSIRPFSRTTNGGDAGPGQRFLSYRHAVADRLASRQDVIEKTRVGIDQDRTRLSPARVIDNMPAIRLRNARLRIRRVGEQLPSLGVKLAFDDGASVACMQPPSSPTSNNASPRPIIACPSKSYMFAISLLEKCRNQGVVRR